MTLDVRRPAPLVHTPKRAHMTGSTNRAQITCKPMRDARHGRAWFGLEPVKTQLQPTSAIMATVAIIAVLVHALSASAQTAKDAKGPTPLVAIQNEAPPKLIVDPPIPEQLALGRVFIQYRTENLRILPVFGKAALEVSPRVGHLHYYVDDQSWPIVDTSGETVVLVGLPPGPHKVRLELADSLHRPIPGASKVVEFTIPTPRGSNN